MWGELASHKRLFNPPPQFSRLGILVSLRPIFIFLVCDVHICVPLFVLVGITFLSLYSLASVLCTCISMCVALKTRGLKYVESVSHFMCEITTGTDRLNVLGTLGMVELPPVVVRGIVLAGERVEDKSDRLNL